MRLVLKLLLDFNRRDWISGGEHPGSASQKAYSQESSLSRAGVDKRSSQISSHFDTRGEGPAFTRGRGPFQGVLPTFGPISAITRARRRDTARDPRQPHAGHPFRLGRQLQSRRPQLRVSAHPRRTQPDQCVPSDHDSGSSSILLLLIHLLRGRYTATGHNCRVTYRELLPCAAHGLCTLKAGHRAHNQECRREDRNDCYRIARWTDCRRYKTWVVEHHRGDSPHDPERKDHGCTASTRRGKFAQLLTD